ncbi:MAG: cell division protein FtsQ/DivIB [Minisyncoccota bacterium]
MSVFKKRIVKSRTEKKATFLRKELPQRRQGRALIIPREQKKHFPWSVYFLWIFFLGTCVYLVFFSSFFLIQLPEVEGTEQIRTEEVVSVLDNVLSGQYFGAVSRHNFFMIRPKALESLLKHEFPLFADVNVHRIFPDRLSIRVLERKHILLWCVSVDRVEMDLSTKQKNCVLVNEAGIAEDANRSLEEQNAPFRVFMIDTSGRSLAIGDSVITPQFGEFVLDFSDLFSEYTEFTVQNNFFTSSRFANEVRLVTNEGWELYVSADVSSEISLQALRLLLEKEIPQEKRTQLAYIDLRTENRVYYAFRDGTGVTEVKASTPSNTPPVTEKKADERKKSKQ